MEEKSKELFERAKKHMPGGVNSPVRAYGAVGRTPRFIASAKGDRITDVDGNEMIDYVCSWGPGILGHAHPRVIQNLKEADVVIDSMDMSESRIAGEGISVHMVLYMKKTVGRTEVYEIITKSDKVMSVDFL